MDQPPQILAGDCAGRPAAHDEHRRVRVALSERTEDRGAALLAEARVLPVFDHPDDLNGYAAASLANLFAEGVPVEQPLRGGAVDDGHLRRLARIERREVPSLAEGNLERREIIR